MCRHRKLTKKLENGCMQPGGKPRPIAGPLLKEERVIDDVHTTIQAANPQYISKAGGDLGTLVGNDQTAAIWHGARSSRRTALQ